MELPQLIQAWRSFEFTDKTPSILNGDEILLANKNNYSDIKNYNDYINSKDFSHPTKLHLGQIPQPFSGDLLNAKIYILMLNPGQLPLDYFAEENMEYKHELLQILKQENLGQKEYPFFFLNPRFLWTGGGTYWYKKLLTHINYYIESNKVTLKDALQFFSKNIAVIQLLPYHSISSPKINLSNNKLKSVELAREFVSNYVLKRVLKNDAGLIVTRKSRSWFIDEIPTHPNIVIYEKSLTRGAHIGKETTAGTLIRKILQIN